MTRIRSVVHVLLPALWLAAVGAGTPLLAQTSSASVVESAPTEAEATLLTETWRAERRRRESGSIRIGENFTLSSGTAEGDVVVLSGDAEVNGHVSGNLVVVLGSARLGPAAVIDGEMVVVGGDLQATDTTVVHGDLVVIGGPADLPPGFVPDGAVTRIGARAVLDRIRAGLTWVVRGLALGRLIVPDLGWVWLVVGLVFVVHLLTAVIGHGMVGATAATVAARPVGSVLSGVVALVLTLPVMVILAVTVVGLPAIPLALVTLFGAALVGRVAVHRAIGERLVPPQDREARGPALRSFLIGSALLVIIYMVPVAGLLAWMTVGTMGLGAALLTLFGAWRGEAPPPPPLPSGPPPMPVPPPLGATEPTVPLPSVMGTRPEAPAALLHYPRATFLERALAFGLDLLLVGVLAGVLSRLLPVLDEAYVPILLATLMAGWVWQGTSMGGLVVGLRVVKADGSRLQVVDALVRGLVGVLSCAVFGLGVLWILRDPQRQAWHDKAVGTVVVKVPRPA